MKKQFIQDVEDMENKRPLLITLICIIGFIGAAFALPLNAYSIVRGDLTWYPLFSLLNGVLGLVAIIGLWKMKRWSIILYTVSYAIVQVVLLLTGRWSLLGLIIPLIVIAIGFYYYRQMD